MTQVWDENNNVVPVTVLRGALPGSSESKTPDSDGYNAVKVTFGTRDARKLSQPEAGHFSKAGVEHGVRHRTTS